jgi:hypothetical protein
VNCVTLKAQKVFFQKSLESQKDVMQQSLYKLLIIILVGLTFHKNLVLTNLLLTCYDHNVVEVPNRKKGLRTFKQLLSS